MHPDKWGGDVKAVRAFQRLGQAFDILKDPDQRTAYDATRRDEVPVPPVPRARQITVFSGDQTRAIRRRGTHFDVREFKDEASRSSRGTLAFTRTFSSVC